jgi:hypothetical protein
MDNSSAVLFAKSAQLRHPMTGTYIHLCPANIFRCGSCGGSAQPTARHLVPHTQQLALIQHAVHRTCKAGAPPCARIIHTVPNRSHMMEALVPRVPHITIEGRARVVARLRCPFALWNTIVTGRVRIPSGGAHFNQQALAARLPVTYPGFRPC